VVFKFILLAIRSAVVSSVTIVSYRVSAAAIQLDATTIQMGGAAIQMDATRYTAPGERLEIICAMTTKGGFMYFAACRYRRCI
jgi:hypothetical protein